MIEVFLATIKAPDIKERIYRVIWSYRLLFGYEDPEFVMAIKEVRSNDGERAMECGEWVVGSLRRELEENEHEN